MKNKTTEALKLAEECLKHLTSWPQANEAIATIREALAEPVKTWSPYHVKELNFCEPVKQEPVAWASKSSIDWLKSKERIIGAFTQTCLSTSKDECADTPLYLAPVPEQKKEAVGFIKLWESVSGFQNSDFEVQLPHGEYEIYTDLSWLYAAPVDAKAIRAEALEDAVKFLEENGMIAPNGFTADGIRGLK